MRTRTAHCIVIITLSSLFLALSEAPSHGQSIVLNRDEARIKAVRRDLARETVLAWNQFKASAQELGLTVLP